MDIHINNSFSIIENKKTKGDSRRDHEDHLSCMCLFCSTCGIFPYDLYDIEWYTPAIFKIGLKEILFETQWAPTAADPKYGILYVILTSIVGTTFAVLIGVPIGVLTAVFIAEVAPKQLAAIVKPAVELLAGIPSVIYGLLGIMILNPFMYKIEKIIFKGSSTHQFTGGFQSDLSNHCTGNYDSAHSN